LPERRRPPRVRPSGHCTICKHPERARAELLAAAGASQVSVAEKLGMSRDALQRHWQNHVPNERKANLKLGPVNRMELAARVAEESSSVIDHYRVLRSGLWTLFNTALEAGDITGGSLVGGKLEKVLSTMARMTGEIIASGVVHQHMHVHLTDSPEFMTLVQEIAEALGPYPEARKAVFARIEAARQAEAQQIEHQPRGEPIEAERHEAH
jgi:hypothetical protein